MHFLRLLLLAWRAYAAVASTGWPPRQRARHECTFEGYYAVSGATTTQHCPGTKSCPPGSYCTGGKQRPCPAGVYGAEEALRTKECSAPCPEGYYCGEGTARPKKCGGAHVYCPLGSTHPSSVPRGFYALGGEALTRSRIHPCQPGSFCIAGTSHKCPAGTYGATATLSSSVCTGLCPVGHYCPQATIRPIPCRPGTYGDRPGLKEDTCAGICPVGYTCPKGTTSATAWPCPHGTVCPFGSAMPQAPQSGYHVVQKTAPEAVPCPQGSFCSPKEAPGSSRLCPGGTFGNVTGLATAACSGPCEAGYYCPSGSTSATPQPCGNVTVFCPSGSAIPTLVAPGSYTIGKARLKTRALDADVATAHATRVAQRQCEPGYYCVNGERVACPAGTFGNNRGLMTADCSGPCTAGYFCPQASIGAQAVACTTSTSFCSSGAALPRPTSEGHCAISNETGNWYAQRKAQPGEFAWRGRCSPCPAGTFGAEEMETRATCSGSCAAGYFCPAGSTSPFQHECGSAAVYCPAASTEPRQVSEGYYTSLQVHALIPNETQAPGCEPGTYRDSSTTVNAFMDAVTGQSPLLVNYGDYSYPVARCVPCPEGTFKPETGDDLTRCKPCPEYTTVSSNDRRTCLCFRRAGGQRFDTLAFALYFDTSMLTCDLVPNSLLSILGDGETGTNSIYTRAEQFPCERGYFCKDGIRSPCPAGFYGDKRLESRATCSGACPPGFYCPFASWNSTARGCRDAKIFCPRGSAVPTSVWPGHYSVSSTNGVNFDGQRPCDLGSFCVDGKRSKCPAGRYGNKTAETSPLCSGLCARGYYCPQGSISSMQSECGGDDVICRTGAPKPEGVLQGYYTIGLTNSTRFYQRLCEPGYFCRHGMRYQCPAGTYGATSGLTTPLCSGNCAPGYYCPSYPGLPSMSPTQNECGSSLTYCPEGTGNEPLIVPSGHFSVRTSGRTDDGRNATQNDVNICPKGFYCRQGIRRRCPEGTFGDVEGLSAAMCRGWCPAGYSCPYATIDYRLHPCAPGTYSTKGSAACIQCPVAFKSRSSVLGNRRFLPEEQAPCTTHRECCYLG